jgi:hypothetical protein
MLLVRPSLRASYSPRSIFPRFFHLFNTQSYPVSTIYRNMATLSAQKKHKITIVGSGNW